MACSSCASACSCDILGNGTSINVTGVGSNDDPYVIDLDLCTAITETTSTGRFIEPTDRALVLNGSNNCELVFVAENAETQPALVCAELKWTGEGEVDLFAFAVDSTGECRNETEFAAMLHPGTLAGSLQYVIPDIDTSSVSVPAGDYYVTVGATGSISYVWPYVDGAASVADIFTYIRIDTRTFPTALNRVWIGATVYTGTVFPVLSDFADVAGTVLTFRTYPAEAVLDTIDVTSVAAGHNWAIFGYFERAGTSWSWNNSLSFPADQDAVKTTFGLTHDFLV